MHKVFVYGTLKQGHGNNRLLEGSLFCGKAITNNTFKMYDGGFPYVVDDNTIGGNYPVIGEVYEVDDATLKRLDGLEGVAYDHYQRIITDVLFNEEWIDTYIYVASDRTAQHVKQDRSFVKPSYDANNNLVYSWR